MLTALPYRFRLKGDWSGRFPSARRKAGQSKRQVRVDDGLPSVLEVGFQIIDRNYAIDFVIQNAEPATRGDPQGIK
jgi:hypothetical protein